jgi:hypothetical protein
MACVVTPTFAVFAATSVLADTAASVFLTPIYTYPYIQEALCVIPFFQTERLRGTI